MLGDATKDAACDLIEIRLALKRAVPENVTHQGSYPLCASLIENGELYASGYCFDESPWSYYEAGPYIPSANDNLQKL